MTFKELVNKKFFIDIELFAYGLGLFLLVIVPDILVSKKIILLCYAILLFAWLIVGFYGKYSYKKLSKVEVKYYFLFNILIYLSQLLFFIYMKFYIFS